MMVGEVVDIAFGGKGVVKTEGKVVFIPYVLKGELVDFEITKDKKQFAEGKLRKVIKGSSQRIEPKCPYFGVCGGCQFQHINYESQLEIKKTFIQEALKRIGGMDISEIPMNRAETIWNYRRRATLHIRKGKLGFFANDNVTFVPVDRCPIFSESLPDLPQDGDKLTLIKQDKGFMGVLEGGKIPKNPKLPDGFASLTYKKGKDIEIIGDPWGEIKILGEPFAFHPLSFLQAHPQVSEEIYAFVLSEVERLQPNKVLDLYCGIGVLSKKLRHKSIESVGIEVSPFSIASAKKNDSEGTYIQGKVETLLPRYLKDAPDLILVNPPRQGIDKELLDKIRQNASPFLIYTSCMPSTLARDLKSLKEVYGIEKIAGFDMFPQTTHVETVVVLKKKAAPR